MAKKKAVQEVIEKIEDYALEEIMGERFARYSKYIIQDRAIPDARDGLKPVQRRILYGMYKERHTYDKPYVKSARSVGDIMGKYHPHGDSSIYDAMVRMSQWWKQNAIYVDMHGNNGSMDGDSPAAMRYTESRLSKISNELLKDIDKDTVQFSPNFDDSLLEPTVLPAKFPNLLVNGSTGISAGYATNIPPHNLVEVIDATIHTIDYPNCSLDTLMKHVKGPDFPTGGIIEGIDGIKTAYETGKGRIVVRSTVTSKKEGGKESLVITAIPYEVNKANLIRKIDDIRIDKKIDGISEVRDESTDDVRIVVDLKKDANKELIENYLLKHTDLQISYNFNMTTIINRRPKVVGLKPLLDAFISHQREVITRRTEFDLRHAEAEFHIVEGLIKCISILDEVIAVIRASKNKADAKVNLIKEFDFSEKQAEAIVMLQLYRLTNTDIVDLEEKLARLLKIIAGLKKILGDEEVLKTVMKEELRKVKKEYGRERLTEIKDEISVINIDTTSMIAKEDVVVMITNDGYIKRTNLRSYNASDVNDVVLKENDYIIGKYQMNTLDTLLVFTSLGNYLYIPVHTIFDIKWKDMAKHISNLVEISENESVVSALPVYNFDEENYLVFASKNGMVKRTLLTDFKVTRYSKPITCMKLKDDDELIEAFIEKQESIFITTNTGYGLSFDLSEIPVVGIKAAGVKGINLKGDHVVSANNFSYLDNEFISIITDKGTGKRVRLSEFDKSSRARRGLLVLREVKTNPYRILKTFILDNKEYIGIKNGDITSLKVTELSIADRYSTGSQISKKTLIDAFSIAELKKQETKKENKEAKEEVRPEKKKVSLQEIDDQLMTIEDFLE